MSPSPATLKITPLATFTPPGSARAWQSAPHPTLPLLATASSDKSVRVYSLSSFQLQSTVAGGHSRSVRSVAWKPNVKGESVLATGSFDASAQIWRRYETVDGIQQIRLKKQQDDDGEGEGGSEDDDDDEEWRFAVILEGHDSEIKSVAWSAGGQYLATCSRDKSVWVWEEMDEDTFETIAVLQEHEADVKSVAWHPSEDLLASGSYDDGVRLYREDIDDWTCVAALNGHSSTVWSIAWEPIGKASNWERLKASENVDAAKSEATKGLLESREKSGPRLVSCSDDLTIRVWRRRPKERALPPTGQGRMPSILRTNDVEEDWFEETRLPQAHERSIYAVAWSSTTGRIVSAGSDGKVVVYEERWSAEKTASSASPEQPEKQGEVEERQLTEWIVLAELDDAHDVYEVNHVCWAQRRDRGKRSEDEEIIVTTGDDGLVKAWALDEA